MAYSVHVNGADVTGSLPSYLTNFNPAVPQITLYTIDQADIGEKVVTIQSRIILNPTDRVADTSITFQLDILDDECLSTILYPETVDLATLPAD